MGELTTSGIKVITMMDLYKALNLDRGLVQSITITADNNSLVPRVTVVYVPIVAGLDITVKNYKLVEVIE
jgi:hypothetical protein